jgi:hypothetical protein
MNLMEDNLTDKDKRYLEWLKELKEEITALQADLDLPEGEKALLIRQLELLLEVEPSLLNMAWFVASVLLSGLKLSFSPSECLASIRRYVTCETDFWSGCISYFYFLIEWDRPGWGQLPWEIGKTKETKDFFKRALKDASLPRKMRMASLQLKAWCHVALWEFDKALMSLSELKQTVSTSEGKERVEYLINYIERLQEYYLGVEEEDPWYIGTLGEQTLLVKEQGELYRHDTKFVFLPHTEFGEFLPEESGKPVPLKGSALIKDLEFTPNLIDTLAEKIKTPILLSLWEAKEEIKDKIPITHTLEETSQVLLKEYGNWVNKLANQGALTNAEFLYKALGARSWGEVIVGYSNAVEAEIKTRLLPQLENFLMAKGFFLQDILPKRVGKGDSDLGYAEAVLRQVKSESIPKELTELFSFLPSETSSFLLDDLPDDLVKLRNLRNPSSHGHIINNAEETRKLVLGTPEKPGLLKRLTEINLWKDEMA